MAGGSGNQFLDIAGTGKTFIRMTYERFLKIVPKDRILVVTLDKYRSFVERQIPELPAGNLLLEPFSRNTAPCLTYATYTLLRRDPDAIMVATPCDLIIFDEALFIRTVDDAVAYATANDVLMTLGIVPKAPDINFGYIQVKGGRAAASSDRPVKVKTFTEKPSEDLAKVFYKSGEFFWNSGIYIWRADTIRTEMERYVPEVTELFKGWEGALDSLAEQLFIERAYADCPKVSVDYGVMEKTDRAWLYPAKFGWTDIG